MTRAHDVPVEVRPHCYVCDKVASLCLCGRVSRVQNRTSITIVQHPREERHPLGTVRIARLGLADVAVHVMAHDAPPIVVPDGAAVLFPDADAPTLDAMPEASRPRHLVVIDGTWEHASQLRRKHPTLVPLPAVRLPLAAPSRYRIRREPAAHALSTIEAIVRALRILEPETEGLDGLIGSFDAMIDDHLEARSAHPYTPRHRKAPRTPKPLPAVLRAETEEAVYVHCEMHRPRGQEQQFPLRFVFARGPDDALDVRVQSPLPVSSARLGNLELGEDPLVEAVPFDEAMRLLRAYVRPTDTLVAWPDRAGAALRELGFHNPFVAVKRQWARTNESRPVGALGAVVAQLGGAPREPWAPGRSGRQLAELHAVVEALRAT